MNIITGCYCASGRSCSSCSGLGSCCCVTLLCGGCCSCNNRSCTGIRSKAAADRNNAGLIGCDRRHQSCVHTIICIINRVVEFPFEVAAVQTTSQVHNNSRYVSGCIRSVAVHDAAVCIEVVVTGAALYTLYRRRYLFVSGGSLISIELGIVFLIGCITGLTFHVVIVGLDDTAVFAGEGAAVIALHGDQHRVFAVSEVVVFNECVCTHRNAYTVLGVAVIVVVINVNGHCTDSRMTGVGVVEPVVVIGDPVFSCLTCHTAQGHLSGIPEVVIRNGNVLGIVLQIHRAVALGLVSIASSCTVENVIVMNPDVIVICFQCDTVIAEQHNSQVTDLNASCSLAADTEAIAYSVLTDTFNGDVLNRAVSSTCLQQHVVGIAGGVYTVSGYLTDKTDTNRT